jgi:hypothetical protein
VPAALAAWANGFAFMTLGNPFPNFLGRGFLVAASAFNAMCSLLLNGGKPFKFLEDGNPAPGLRPQPKEYPTLSSITAPKRSRVHEPAWRSPVQKLVNRVSTTRMAREKQAKVDESKLMHELAWQLIDIGYKVLATKLLLLRCMLRRR